MKNAIKSFVIIACMLMGVESAKAIVIPAGKDPAFNNQVRDYIAAAKETSPYLFNLIRIAETLPNVIYVFPITDNEDTWHYSGNRNRSHTDPRDSKRRGAARNTPTDSYIFIVPGLIDPNDHNYGRGTLVHELVHAVDLAKGLYNREYPLREKRAGFFENIWREAHDYPLRTNYADRFPVIEYQVAKSAGGIEDFIEHYYNNNDVP